MECSSLVSLLFVLLIPAVVENVVVFDLIDQTCLKTAYPLFCSSIIRPDSRSIKAKGPADLGIIMLDHVDMNAQSAITKITPLINQAGEPRVKGALLSCNEGYISTVSEWMPLSKDSFNNNDPRFAYQYMTNASQAALRCEDGFKGLGISPLTDLNDFANKAAIVCAAIAKSLM